MDEEVDITTDKKASYWTSWVTWCVITCLCIVANFLIPIILQFPGFSTWQSLPKPPSEAIHIVDADGLNVWIRAKDGHVYTWSWDCEKFFTENLCNQWIKVDDAAEIKSSSLCYIPEQRRGPSCKGLDPRSPNNPLFEKVTECVKGVTCLIPVVTYFAVLSNGTVKYWRDTGIVCWYPLACSTSFIVAILRILLIATFATSVIYLVKNVSRRHRAG